MRIVGGKWRGRPLRAPKGQATRPTSDRVREALFDALSARMGSDLSGGAVLDLYAGTGALALEALSRGACRAVLIENERGALAAMRANITALDAEEATVVVDSDAGGPGLTRASSLGPYALLLVDPPYRIDAARIASAMQALHDAGALEPGAIVAYEHASGADVEPVEHFATIRTYVYGDTAVTLLSHGDAEALT
jgi:16S rRNA (guanine966-N2)-methyltransferase